MSLNWSKWGLDFWKSIARHVGTAGLAAMAICTKEGKFDWKNFGIAILVGGVIPSVLTFLQSSPAPEDEPPKP